jgi:polysaccharide biosynthesis/export protein
MVRSFCTRLLTAIAIAALPLAAQQYPTPTPAPAPTIPDTPNVPESTTGADIYGGYSIGIGDILDIRVADEPTVSGRYQVDQDGLIQMPLLSGPIHAASTTTFLLAKELQQELKAQRILREPSVTVFIARGMTQNVTVLGAVARPGIYSLEQPTTLLEVLSRAGGVQPNAGKELLIAHRTQAGKNTPTPGTETSVDLPALMSGKDPSMNALAQAGDVITVTNAPVVFVVGAVGHPGAFAVQGSKGEMTVLQAVAMAEGTQPTASLGKAVIVRQLSDSQRQEIPIDLGKVFKNKDSDRVLLANDILFVPQSGFKQGVRKVGDAAVNAAGQVAGYGMGVRLGR